MLAQMMQYFLGLIIGCIAAIVLGIWFLTIPAAVFILGKAMCMIMVVGGVCGLFKLISTFFTSW